MEKHNSTAEQAMEKQAAILDACPGVLNWITVAPGEGLPSIWVRPSHIPEAVEHLRPHFEIVSSALRGYSPSEAQIIFTLRPRREPLVQRDFTASAIPTVEGGIVLFIAERVR